MKWSEIHKKKLLIGLFVSALMLSLIGCSSSDDSGPATSQEIVAELMSDSEIETAWANAMVRLPDGFGGVQISTTGALAMAVSPTTERLPVIVYLHGCAGFWSGSPARLDGFAQQGFAVFAPASLTRPGYPTSCDVTSFQTGLARETLQIRQRDTYFALLRLQDFSWIDYDNIFLYGLSEGAAVAATLDVPNQGFGHLKARILEGWTCHAGWIEYAGLAARTEAVLSLVGDNDPWYQASYHRGDCGAFMTQGNASESIVFYSEPLRSVHELLEFDVVRELVNNFLQIQLQNP